MESREPFVRMVTLPAALEHLKRRTNEWRMPKDMYYELMHILHEVFDGAARENGVETAVICRCPKCRRLPSIVHTKNDIGYGSFDLEVRIGCSKECDMPPFIVHRLAISAQSWLRINYPDSVWKHESASTDDEVQVASVQGDEYVSMLYEEMEQNAVRAWNDQCVRYSLRQLSQENGAAVNFTNDPAEKQ